MARKLIEPISQKFGERPIVRDQENFAAGMIHDEPASEIADDSVAYLWNANAYPRKIRGRNGTKLWSDTPYPALDDRTGYSLTQTGTTVTSLSGNIFAASDVQNWIVFDDGTHVEIVDYLSATQVTVDFSQAATGTACWMHGTVNARKYHTTQKKIVMHMGTDIYVADSVISAWTKMTNISYRFPADCDSKLCEDGDEFFLINSKKTFRIILDDTFPHYFEMNSPCPNIPPVSNVEDDALPWGRRYLYSMSLLTKQINIRTRESTDEGVKIVQESGTTLIREDGVDYGQVWTEKARGDGTKFKMTLTGAEIADASKVVGYWQAIADASITVEVNGEVFTVYADLTNCENMTAVAAYLQAAIRQKFVNVTVEYKGDHFIMGTGDVDGDTIDYVTAGDGVAGTDVAAVLCLRAADGATLVTEAYEVPKIIQGFYAPKIPELPTIPHWHWTHYSIYGTLRLNGKDLNSGDQNDPEIFIWLYDLRVAAAFYASKSNGIITATYGEFEKVDVGSVIEWEDGDRDTITAYIDSTHVNVDNAYYHDDKALMAAAIGNGDVIRASQTGNVVTITSTYNNHKFTAADVGKRIWWSTGYYSFIKEYLTPNTVEVWDSIDKPSEGITVDATHRNFYDMIDDEFLRARSMASSKILRSRYLKPMPEGNTGCVSPGFFFSAIRGYRDVAYCQLPVGQHYLAGYYNDFYQLNDDIKDGITDMDSYTNRVIAFCSNTWWAGPTNTSGEMVTAGGQAVVTFNGFQIGGNIGLLDYGSYKKFDLDAAIMITSEPAPRIFDGYNFGANLAETKDGQQLVSKEIKSWMAATAVSYHPDHGLLFWGKK